MVLLAQGKKPPHGTVSMCNEHHCLGYCVVLYGVVLQGMVWCGFVWCGARRLPMEQSPSASQQEPLSHLSPYFLHTPTSSVLSTYIVSTTNVSLTRSSQCLTIHTYQQCLTNTSTQCLTLVAPAPIWPKPCHTIRYYNE